MVKEYVARPHFVKGLGILNLKGLAKVKRYSMIPQERQDFNMEERRIVDMLLEKEFSKGKIKPYLGSGFSIMSDGILNICMWGGEFPSLLNQRVYSFDRDGFNKKRLENSGTFCCWEVGIVSHEAEAWRKYLLSKRTERDLDNYLANFFQGIVN